MLKVAEIADSDIPPGRTVLNHIGCYDLRGLMLFQMGSGTTIVKTLNEGTFFGRIPLAELHRLG